LTDDNQKMQSAKQTTTKVAHMKPLNKGGMILLRNEICR